MLNIIQDRNNNQIFKSIKKLGIAQTTAIRKSFYDIGKDLIAESKNLINKKPKTGRVYMIRLSGRLRKHKASAPGEAPANLTYALRKSLDFTVQGAQSLEYGSKDGQSEGVEYGRALELGNSRRNLSPRPYLKPSVDKNQKNANNHFVKNFEKILKIKLIK